MSDFQINDHILQQECMGIASDAYGEAIENGGCDRDDIDAIREAASEHIDQTCDGHQWCIYNYQALKVCAECNVSDGEEFLEAIGLPEDVTIYKLASVIVYGELRARAMEHLESLLADEPEAD